MAYRKMCNIICKNCGIKGHTNKTCPDPVTSFGLININIKDCPNDKNIICYKYSSDFGKNINITSEKYPDVIYKQYTKTSPRDVNLKKTCLNMHSRAEYNRFNYYKNRIYFMMVSRKYSLGFIEFIRGMYDISDTKQIIRLFEQMYEEEIKFIGELDYDSLLFMYINKGDDPKQVQLSRVYEGKYSPEYCKSKIKFNVLKYGKCLDSEFMGFGLNFYVKNIRPLWNHPEWGFPKGRMNYGGEKHIDCAKREFEEETGTSSICYNVLDNVNPLCEYLTGTNNVEYKHIYYLSMKTNDIDYTKNRSYDELEIGEVKWFTYDQAIRIIRPYHTGKKNVLSLSYIFILEQLIHQNVNCM